MRRLVFPLLVTIAFAAPPANKVGQEFRARDQALLDAIAPGNVCVWEAALAPGAMYVDENGTSSPATSQTWFIPTNRSNITASV